MAIKKLETLNISSICSTMIMFSPIIASASNRLCNTAKTGKPTKEAIIILYFFILAPNRISSNLTRRYRTFVIGVNHLWHYISDSCIIIFFYTYYSGTFISIKKSKKAQERNG